MKLDLTKSMVKNDQIFNKTYQQKISAAHTKLHSASHEGGTTWVDWPVNYDKAEFALVEKLAKQIKSNSNSLLVIGIGGSYLGAKSGIELLNKGKGIEVIFAGINFDYIDLYSKLEYLKNKDVTVNVVSKSGTTVEILTTYTIVEKFMKNKYGKDYKDRIIFTTDREKGYLRRLGNEQNITCLTVPDDMGGRYSVLSSVGMLPFACAGLNVKQIMAGAVKAYNDLNTENLKTNPAYQYAVYRNLVYTNLGKQVEIFSSFASRLSSFGAWLTQLFDESEGKENKGLFVTSLTFSTDLHSVGQYIQEGSKILAETFLDVTKPLKDTSLHGLSKTSPIKFLEGKTIGEVARAGFLGTVKAHSEAGVPIAILTIDEINEFNYGYMVYFFEIACATSAYLIDVNPFNQPGVEQYKSYMRQLLKK